jgi:hypothetical protein
LLVKVLVPKLTGLFDYLRAIANLPALRDTALSSEVKSDSGRANDMELIVDFLAEELKAEPVIDYLAEELKREEKQQRTDLKAMGKAAGVGR